MTFIPHEILALTDSNQFPGGKPDGKPTSNENFFFGGYRVEIRAVFLMKPFAMLRERKGVSG